jgi:60 kDa SS-A/Ro ribonucleoprotein
VAKLLLITSLDSEFLVVREMARASAAHKALVADTLFTVIQRPDEITEFLAIYWKDGKQPLSAQVKKGLARA